MNNWNIISANFVEVTNRGAYLYFMGASIRPPVRLRLCVWRAACMHGVYGIPPYPFTHPPTHAHCIHIHMSAFHIAVVTIGLNCVTSFFIGNLSNKLSEELEVCWKSHVSWSTDAYATPVIDACVYVRLSITRPNAPTHILTSPSSTQSNHTTTAPKQHQVEEKRRKKEEAERAKAKGLDPASGDHVIKFKVERRVSSDDLMLMDVSSCLSWCGWAQGRHTNN